ncbi:MAG: integrase core domain-containing protein [candidate division KSB1 bacterium]|nr:integrase core domain-containing protein [candidate division KSB1 bacterium]MDZ7377266.1 integrase core domain-containing protein [candidate division KSB1 bacterium]
MLSWQLSISLDSTFYVDLLDEALECGCPEIVNTDQGRQFACDSHNSHVTANRIKISMGSKGRAIDTVLNKRLWRSLKYQYVYFKAPEAGEELDHGLDDYFNFYHNERAHQSLGY